MGSNPNILFLETVSFKSFFSNTFMNILKQLSEQITSGYFWKIFKPFQTISIENQI